MKKIGTSTTIVKSLTLLGVLGFMPLVLAKIPHASEIVSIQGNKVMFQEGRQRRKFAQIGQKLENKNHKLIISGNQKDLARLILLGGGNNYEGMLLQAGPDSQETQYQFPCTLEKGKLTIGWQQGKNRGCEDGIYLSPQNKNKSHNKQNLKLQAYRNQSEESSTIRIRPHQTEPILFQVHHLNEQQQVKAIKGKLWLSTPDYPDGFVLEEGEQWNNNLDNQETINKIQVQSILNSEPIQDFLTPQNWSSNFLSEQNNSQVTDHLQTLQSDLAMVIDKPEPTLMSMSCQVEVNNYITKIKNSLNGSWKPVKPPQRGVWKSLISYTITKDGDVQNIQVLQTSGYEPLDEAAIDHISTLKDNFSPFPPCYPGDSLPVDHIFKLLFF